MLFVKKKTYQFRMQNLQIVLTREHQSTPWGFRLKGGAEYNVPLSVLKVSSLFVLSRKTLSDTWMSFSLDRLIQEHRHQANWNGPTRYRASETTRPCTWSTKRLSTLLDCSSTTCLWLSRGNTYFILPWILKNPLERKRLVLMLTKYW